MLMLSLGTLQPTQSSLKQFPCISKANTSPTHNNRFRAEIISINFTSQCIRKIGKDLERMRTNENKVERSMRTPFYGWFMPGNG